MNKLADILEKHLTKNGVIIWQTTTPVPPNAKDRVDTDVQRMNKLADTLWSKYSDVTINDLYSQLVLACHSYPGQECYPESCSCESMQQEADVHSNEVGNAFIGQMVAISILKALGLD